MGIGRFRRLLTLTLLLAACFSVCPAWSAAAAPDVESLIQQAREASGANDHATAVVAYREAIALEPARRDSLSFGLASQLTWAGRHDEAIAEFRWLLRKQPGHLAAWRTLALAQAWSGRTPDALASYRAVLVRQPRDLDARYGEARMLSWLGRTTQSVHAYESLLRDAPDHRDGRLGLAMVHNWRGDHERSGRMFSSLIETDPSSAAAYEGLAWAQHWNGRPDLALQTLSRQEQAGARSTAGEELRAIILREWSAHPTLAFDYAEDSDDFISEAARLDFEFPIAYRGHARAGVVLNRFSRTGRPDVEDTWITLGGDARLHQRWSASARAQLAIKRPDGADYTPVQEEVNLAWLGGDRVRADLGYSHFALFSYESNPDRILGDQVGAGLTLRPEHRTTLIVSGDYASYSDDNERRGMRARARYALFARKPRTFVELGAQSINFRRDLPNGIWTPDDYRAGYGRVDFEINPDRSWTFVGALDGGWAKEAPGDYTPYLAYSGAFIWRIDQVRLEALAGRSDGNLETERGYRRTFGALQITGGF
ncbi:MAG: hypothetical protein IT349_05100 [Candidatus Eisenbacteria bacterium]|nr:hypothetical protein [Candidatus Eisenbacteria bacterium]MCC7141461.1 hypothetical protein [Candidatus Eisenbacteria bacterium]